MILINGTFACDIGRVRKDPYGNNIIIELTVYGKTRLVNLCGRNADKLLIYKGILQIVSDFGNANIIFCGDLNLVLKS